MALRLLVLLGVAFLDGGHEFGKFRLVLGADLRDSENSCCL